MRRLRTLATGEDGQVMLLSIAFAVLAMLLVTVVVSASGVHLERKRLLALADLAAVEAADALDDAAYFSRVAVPGQQVEAGDLLVLTPGSVRAAVEDYLADAGPAADLDRLTLVEATTHDGRTATVTLRALATPTLISWVTAPWSDGLVLEVTASARAG